MSDFPKPVILLESLDSGLVGGEIASLSAHGGDSAFARSFFSAAKALSDAQVIEFEMKVRVDAEIEVEYIRNSGDLPYLFRDIIKATKSLWPISLPTLSYFLAFRSYA